MLTRRQIERMAERREFGLLVDRVLGNGRCQDRSVAQLLKQQDVLEIAALGLALQRYGELSGAGASTGNRSAVAGGSASIAQRLVARLEAWLGQGDAAPRLHHPAGLATLAVAVRALLSWQRSMLVAMGRDANAAASAHGTSGQVRSLIDRMLAALARAQEHEGMIGDPLASAVILWQLGAEPTFCRTDACQRLRQWLSHDGQAVQAADCSRQIDRTHRARNTIVQQALAWAA